MITVYSIDRIKCSNYYFFHSLQAELAAHKSQNLLEDPTLSSSNMSSSSLLKDKRPVYRHNQQLEELRNLQDKLTHEKESWIRERDSEMKDLEEKREQLLRLQVSVSLIMKVCLVLQIQLFSKNTVAF